MPYCLYLVVVKRAKHAPSALWPLFNRKLKATGEGGGESPWISPDAAEAEKLSILRTLSQLSSAIPWRDKRVPSGFGRATLSPSAINSSLGWLHKKNGRPLKNTDDHSPLVVDILDSILVSRNDCDGLDDEM